MNVLFVCHANLCRSPMAERLLRHALGDPRSIGIHSAGTHARPGLPMHTKALLTLSEAGVHGDGFMSRPLESRLIRSATLILTADRVQRAACATLDPSALRKSFTIRQFGRLLAADPAVGEVRAGDLDGLVEGLRRLQVQPVPPEADDLADPVAGTAEDFRACLADIEAALRPLVAVLT